VGQTQNRGQKVFNRGLCSSAGGISFVRGLDIIKLTRIPLIYSVSRFNLGGLELCLGGLSPPKPLVATGLVKPQAGAYCWRQKLSLETSLKFLIARFANLDDLDEISQ